MNKVFLCAAAMLAANGTLISGYAQQEEMVKDFGFNFSPKGTEVTYYSYRGDALPDVFKRRGHGLETNLTNRSDTWDIEPDYSPDGGQIIYSSGVDMASLSLRIMNADGSDDRVFFDGEDNEVATKWSPDGSMVLFAAFNNDLRTNVLYIVDANGKNLRSLTSELPGQSSGASWSSDSRKILFVNRPDETTQRDIYSMHADGSGLTRLTHDELSQIAPVYSTDGSSIFFIATIGDGPSDLYAMSADGLADGHKPVRISEPDGTQKYFLTLGPDGETLVYSIGDWDKGFHMGHLPAPKLP